MIARRCAQAAGIPPRNGPFLHPELPDAPRLGIGRAGTRVTTRSSKEHTTRTLLPAGSEDCSTATSSKPPSPGPSAIGANGCARSWPRKCCRAARKRAQHRLRFLPRSRRTRLHHSTDRGTVHLRGPGCGGTRLLRRTGTRSGDSRAGGVPAVQRGCEWSMRIGTSGSSDALISSTRSDCLTT